MKNARLVDLAIRKDSRGELGVFEDIPFSTIRVFWICNVPEGIVRGGHAHRENEQVHMCLTGAVTFVLNDGKAVETIRLRAGEGLYTGPMIWHTLQSFEPHTVLFVANSVKFDENEYIRDYNEFLSLIRGPA